jgi:hypothetical protein
MLSVNEFPAGSNELSGETQVLKQIRITPPRPH